MLKCSLRQFFSWALVPGTWKHSHLICLWIYMATVIFPEILTTSIETYGSRTISSLPGYIQNFSSSYCDYSFMQGLNSSLFGLYCPLIMDFGLDSRILLPSIWIHPSSYKFSAFLLFCIIYYFQFLVLCQDPATVSSGTFSVLTQFWVKTFISYTLIVLVHNTE